MHKSTINILIFTFLFFYTIAFAKDHPYSTAFEATARELFFIGDVVSQPKVDAFRRRLEQKRAELRVLVQQQDIIVEGRSVGAAEEDALEHKYIENLDIAIAHLQRIHELRSMSEVLHELKLILDIEAAIRFEGAQPAISYLVEQTQNFFFNWRVRKHAPASAQASNLYHNGAYLAADAIDAFRSAGGDLSQLDPGPESTFWERPRDISKVDIAAAALGKTLKLYEGIDPRFPENKTFWFQEVKASDTKPKINVYYRDADGKKVKFKLKFGSEINSDPTASALTMALGYPADLVRHVKDVRVILGKKRTISDLTREWESYYRRDNPRRNSRIEKFIKESGTDIDGNNFVVFREAMIEAKPKQIARLGGWRFGDFGHTAFRELRGLVVLQMWLNNVDLKEFDNNRLLVTSRGRAHAITDLGGTFGGLILEKPELFPAKMVKSQSKDFLTFNYRTLPSNSIRSAITYDDARWASRQIAQLTRSQIRTAVDIGHWPACIADIYVEKLIARRNDLVNSFQLVGDRGADGRAIEIMPVDLSPQRTRFDLACDTAALERDFTSEYDFDLGFLLRPAGARAIRTMVDLTRGTLNNLRRVTVDPVEIGLVPGTIGQVLLSIQRTFERNPNPTSEKDMFIFQDHFEIGLRLGVSYGLFKDATYIRKFTISYPTRSIEEGRFKDYFITSVLLPFNVASGKLPEQYVLLTEHYLEHGGGIELDAVDVPVSPTLRAKAARVLLLRSFIDHRDPNHYVLYRDRNHYSELSIRAYARLISWKFPLFTTLRNWGSARGIGARLTKNVAESSELSTAIQRAMVQGDYKDLEKTERRFSIETSFNGSARRWNLLLWSANQTTRLDRIRVSDDNATSARETVQYRETRRLGRNFFWRENETRDVTIEAFVDADALTPVFQLDLEVGHSDTLTSDEEMERSYLYFINGLSASGKPIIPFTVALGYSTNGQWGATLVRTRTFYQHVGLMRLLTISQKDFFAKLAETELASPSISPAEARTLKAKSQLVWEQIRSAQLQTQRDKQLKAIARIFSRALYRQRGFYEVRLIGTINRLVGLDNLYTSAEVSAPNFVEQNFLNDNPLVGAEGSRPAVDRKFLVYLPASALELYDMFNFLGENSGDPHE